MRLIWNILENVAESKTYNRVSIVKKFIELNSPSLYAIDANKIDSEIKQVDEEIKKGSSTKEAIKNIALKYNVNKKELYNFYHNEKGEQ